MVRIRSDEGVVVNREDGGCNASDCEVCGGEGCDGDGGLRALSSQYWDSQHPV